MPTFHRYMTIPDSNPGRAAVLDRNTDRVIADGLDPVTAAELVRSWNRHEPPEVTR